MDGPLLDRRFLEKLERLTIRWEKSFAGLVGGHNPSRFAGGGQEFLDHRHFHHGDDLRAVNWRAYMRLEKLFLKMFQIEPRVPVRMLVDTSRSMAAPEESKLLYAKRLAAALCYVGLVRLDSIVVQPFDSTLGERHLCSGGRHRFSPAMDFLAQLEPGGKGDWLHLVREFHDRYAQPGLLIIISDFLGETSCDRELQYLADFGHELFLVQLWHDDDREPPWRGELDLVDSESGEELRIEIDEAAQKRHTEAFDNYAASLLELAVRNRGRYVGAPVSMPLDDLIAGPMIRARGIA